MVRVLSEPIEHRELEFSPERGTPPPPPDTLAEDREPEREDIEERLLGATGAAVRPDSSAGFP
ncbi:hypothetical protein GCM10022252_18980 [Streptosporangium oxazolinicum]|uniref:Uncharacterized protein n=1 Tax=Streptosporangium oxazolinicum TaxID=909287 RepID=A0ABP8AMZ7_9ACTN